MNLHNLERPEGIRTRVPKSALDKWNPRLQSREDEDAASISILDVIGDEMFGGVSARRVAAALRSIGDLPVTVNINSPGGDLFEGIAIYNLLREHPERVTVKVLGMAASAASIVSMAGDRILMGDASFMMIHNVWVLAIGDRNVLANAAETLGSFDDALAELYSDRTGQRKEDVAQLMDNETWFNTSEAVEIGMADDKLPKKEIKESDEQNTITAERTIEAALCEYGMTRDKRRSLIGEVKGQGAVAPDNHPAVADDDAKLFRELVGSACFSQQIRGIR